jgi:hypothetical protein
VFDGHLLNIPSESFNIPSESFNIPSESFKMPPESFKMLAFFNYRSRRSGVAHPGGRLVISRSEITTHATATFVFDRSIILWSEIIERSQIGWGLLRIPPTGTLRVTGIVRSCNEITDHTTATFVFWSVDNFVKRNYRTLADRDEGRLFDRYILTNNVIIIIVQLAKMLAFLTIENARIFWLLKMNFW